jgi:FAD/FMN-containing dehydrogenase
VGGWLARDGLGIGSYEFGRLSENVVSVQVVLPGGEKRELRGQDLTLVIGAEGATGIIVGATLLLREAEHDMPLAAVFDEAEDLAKAIEELYRARSPLWHLGLMNPARARAGGLQGGYILFGAYHAEVGSALEEMISKHKGRMLPPAEAYRAWGGRFFPAGLSGETPFPYAVLIPNSGLADVLLRLKREAADLALQGTLVKDGGAQLLAFRNVGGRLESPDTSDEESLLQLAKQAAASTPWGCVGIEVIPAMTPCSSSRAKWTPRTSWEPSAELARSIDRYKAPYKKPFYRTFKTC